MCGKMLWERGCSFRLPVTALQGWGPWPTLIFGEPIQHRKLVRGLEHIFFFELTIQIMDLCVNMLSFYAFFFYPRKIMIIPAMTQICISRGWLNLTRKWHRAWALQSSKQVWYTCWLPRHSATWAPWCAQMWKLEADFISCSHGWNWSKIPLSSQHLQARGQEGRAPQWARLSWTKQVASSYLDAFRWASSRFKWCSMLQASRSSSTLVVDMSMPSLDFEPPPAPAIEDLVGRSWTVRLNPALHLRSPQMISKRFSLNSRLKVPRDGCGMWTLAAVMSMWLHRGLFKWATTTSSMCIWMRWTSSIFRIGSLNIRVALTRSRNGLPWLLG